MTPHNSIMRAVFLILLFFPLWAWAQSTPVFLTPNNPAPTGHFDLKMLKKRAINYDQFEWLWVRDQKGHDGWILKASALLPLDFSRQAILGKGEPIHPQPRNFNLPQKTLPQSQIVTLVSRHREWYRIIYKEGDNKFYGWVRSQYLSPYSKDAGFFFSKEETYLRAEPKIKSKVLAKVDPGLPIIPLNTKGDWALVSYNNQKGYLPLRNFKSRLDVAIKVRTEKGYFKPSPELYNEKVLEIFANPIWVGSGAYTLELKAKPDMASDTVSTLAPWQDLILQGYSIKKWGQSHVPNWGELWWPETTIESNVEIIENLTAQSIQLRTSEIYQIEKSPTIKGLRFAAATKGVYRSFDGKNWYPLTPFKFGYPIKVARNGTLFVGDQVSFDHGESFQHFIRWDLVFNSVPQLGKDTKGPIQILNVEPNQTNHSQITLSLRVGSNKYVQLYTPDFGRHWRLR